MNRIQRIQNFLEDYNNLIPSLKYIIEPIRQEYQKELIEEYLKISKHPYPNEYLDTT